MLTHCNRLMILFLILTSSFLSGTILENRPESQNLVSFLEVLAQAEADHWQEITQQLPVNFPDIIGKSSLRQTLNTMKSSILASGNIDLYHLLHRAIRNYDTFMPNEKADPVTSYYTHYSPPAFLIPDIDLTLEVNPTKVKVTTKLNVQRNGEETSLVLDGRDHNVLAVFLNEKKLPRESYKVTPHELILLSIPQEPAFTVTIESEINPFTNHSLEGLYQCDQWLITQCEAEGARHIFFTLDRPDNLSRITTTIIADKERYPYRLSNGDLVQEVELEPRRTSITWKDPIPKPSYLFAAVLGDFAVLKDEFVTRRGNKVDLQVYVEHGKEARAAYSLFALKKAMEFDEVYFDREYDLNCLKMVGVPNFNQGGMENKGLIVFNDRMLLVDSKTGLDADFRTVAHVVAHEYFHNWSGNRVTVRNWFEIALKEAFTESRAMQYNEWMFGSEFIRPKDVVTLWEAQFPSEHSEHAHPLIVESYVSTDSIYDATTYVKGSEVFRTLQAYLNMLVPEGFKEAQNLYFAANDGKAVTFKELLAAADIVLKRVGKDSSSFEHWFYQQGTPVVQVEMDYDSEMKRVTLRVTQSCPHPKTGQEQEPLPIPFSLELLAKDGTVLNPQEDHILTEKITTIVLPANERPIPIFMHGYSAPVILKYDYSMEECACIIKHSDDPFSRWNAGRHYANMALKTVLQKVQKQEDAEFESLQLYVDALQSQELNPLAKAQLLQFPSIRSLAQTLNCYDFQLLAHLRSLYIKKIASVCKPVLERLLEENPEPSVYTSESKDMQIRELRNACLGLLAKIDPLYVEQVYENYLKASNFNNYIASFNTLINVENEHRVEVLKDFYNRWKHDKGVFTNWLSSIASSSECTVDNLRWMETVEGFDGKNPNHIRAVVRTFTSNPSCYHDREGEGYKYMVDKILEIGSFNPLLANNYIARPAFEDFEKLPPHQQALMAKQIERLLDSSVPAQIRDTAFRMLHSFGHR